MPNSNWYAREKERTEQIVRYIGDIHADITVPDSGNNDKDYESAHNVLSTFLPESGDASLHSGIKSSVNLNIQSVRPYV